jgi:DNA-binding transcriptional MerR regulator
MEPLVYREEVLTIMALLRDIRFELEEIHRILGDDDAEEEEENA